MSKSHSRYIREYENGDGVLLETTNKTIYLGYRRLIITVDNNFIWDYFYNDNKHRTLQSYVGTLDYLTPMKLSANCEFIADELNLREKCTIHGSDMLDELLGRLDEHQKDQLPQWFVEGLISEKLKE